MDLDRVESTVTCPLRGECEMGCNVDLGCSTMVAIKLAVESYRQRKTMLWDVKGEKVRTA